MSVLADEVAGSRGTRARERERLMRERRAKSVKCIVDVFCFRGWFCSKRYWKVKKRRRCT